ncbi:MAG: hypothetical protein GAK45_01038 [Pseudomonas citronellolis]|nr:MAG: hypothetical protein GAK45_01038 [Pseudomonas citronellolis]
MQAVEAMRQAQVFFLFDKGASKQRLGQVRRDLCERYATPDAYRIVEVLNPERELLPGQVYEASVHEVNDERQALFERLLLDELGEGECGAYLVWGDPGLYDSTLRILQAIVAGGRVALDYEVIPGITSVQALAARHKVPLNSIGGALQITTGRRLESEGWPAGVDDLLVMLDSRDAFEVLQGASLDIYWGAYLGLPEEVLISGPLEQVAGHIREARQQARARHGWIMDCYLLKRRH